MMAGGVIKVAVAALAAAGLAFGGWTYATGWHPPADQYPLQGVDLGPNPPAVEWGTVRARGAEGQAGEHRPPRLRSRPHEEAVVARGIQLGQRQVVAALRLRPAAHRGAEAGGGRIGAGHGDEERPLAPGGGGAYVEGNLEDAPCGAPPSGRRCDAEAAR